MIDIRRPAGISPTPSHAMSFIEKVKKDVPEPRIASGPGCAREVEDVHQSCQRWLDRDSPVDCAKQRLIEFRRCQSWNESLSDLLWTATKEDCTTKSNAYDCLPSHVLEDVRTVFRGDTWKGAECGRQWIQVWHKWEAPFNDHGTFHFGKGAKRKDNIRWYFGRDDALESKRESPTAAFVAEGNHSGPAPDTASSSSCEADDNEEIILASPILQNCFPDTTPSQETMTIQEDDRDLVLSGLRGYHSCETLTICSLTSKDTIPLGTDLDPLGYNNLWAAKEIKDPNGRLLVKFNLCCRVVDGENVGYSFGKDVLGQQKKYDLEGVRRAVEHFRARGIHVIVVTKHPDTAQQVSGDGVQVVLAERTDDLMVLKEARKFNCPIVSRDGFAKWRTDLRVSDELKKWLAESTELQVRFSWGTAGEFVPDFDLPRPVLRSADQKPRCGECGCGRSDNNQGRWAWYDGVNVWYCDSCWRQWRR
jgi:hypothetical protein